MTDSSNAQGLNPSAARVMLRALAAEQLMEVSDPAQAAHALFDLIAADLKLGAFLLYMVGDDGCLHLIAHGGISEAEATIAAAQGLDACGNEEPTAFRIPAILCGQADANSTFLNSMGFGAWFGHPLMEGERLIGILGFGRRKRTGFNEEDLAFLRRVSHFFALALARLRGEAALRESEERLELGMAFAGFGTFEANLVTGEAIVSSHMFSILGLPQGCPVTLGMLRESVHPDDRERVHGIRLACYDPTGPGEFSDEHRLLRPDGTVCWVHVRFRAFFAGEGKARRAVRVMGVERDITESKLAEQRLRESEERLRLAIEAAGFGTFEYDMDRDELTWSPELGAIYGIDAKGGLTLESTFQHVHPDDRKGFMEIIHAAMRTEGPEEYQYEHRIIRPDGEMRWVISHARLLISPAGSRRTVGIAQDITERKLAEQRLLRSEERLRLAIQTAGLGIFDYDIGRDELIWSPELRTIFGFDPDEFIDNAKVALHVHPDDREQFLEILQSVLGSDQPGDYPFEYRIFRPDGEMRWVLSMARVLLDSGPAPRRHARIVGITLDITERKLAEQRLRQSEQRLRRAQEMGEVASFEWEPLTDTVWVSESFRRTYGLPPDYPTKLEALTLLPHPDDRIRVDEHMWKCWRTGEPQKFEFRVVRPSDHQIRWLWLVCGASQDGSVTRVAGIALDITERKRNEERARLLSREVDHRAKNLLSVVQAMVQLTHADSIPEFVDQVKGRIQALGRVHGLLAASRWDGAELSRLIQEELAPFADGWERIQLTGPSVALKPVAAQSMALVIHELTTNAAKFGALSVPGGRIEIGWECGDTVAGQLVLHWREHGGPPVKAPKHGGFGLNIVRDSMKYQLGASVDMRWYAEGLEYKLVLPARQLVH